MVFYDWVWPEAGAHQLYGHGRAIEHDERSRNFPVRGLKKCPGWPSPLPPKPKPKNVLWEPRISALNQGNLGACTGYALVHAMSAAPEDRIPVDVNLLTGDLAVKVYSNATEIDQWQGEYPPTDTGSSGLAVMKVAKRRGWVSGYTHGFKIEDLPVALQRTPVICGIAWRQNMYHPDSKGVVTWSGPVVGGHEFAVIGWKEKTKMFTCRNSWGPFWGKKGNFKIHMDELAAALDQFGDVTVPDKWVAA